jgi:hypothetical protein
MMGYSGSVPHLAARAGRLRLHDRVLSAWDADFGDCVCDSDQPAGDGGADKFVKMPPPSTPSKGRTVEHNAYAITRHAARWKIANSCQITTVLFCPYVEIEGQGLVS